MAVNAAWPPLAALSMFVVIVAFIIIKYGDRLFRARSVPINRDLTTGAADDDNSSVNTVSCRFLNDKETEAMESESMKGYQGDYIDMMEQEHPNMTPAYQDQDQPRPLEKYEYAV